MPRLKIPYFETSRYKVETMVKLSNVHIGDKVADLGSGDARISIAFGKKGACVTGFELDSELISQSEKLIKAQKLESNIKIIQADFWNVDLSEFSIVAVYPMPDIMPELEKKLLSELSPGSRVVTNYYKFPNWEVKEADHNVYLYVV